jgi:hypothetical protein
MSEPESALVELLAVAGFDLAQRGNDWIATYRDTGQQIEGASPIQTARRALALLRNHQDAPERAAQLAEALARMGITEDEE